MCILDSALAGATPDLSKVWEKARAFVDTSPHGNNSHNNSHKSNKNNHQRNNNSNDSSNGRKSSKNSNYLPYLWPKGLELFFHELLSFWVSDTCGPQLVRVQDLESLSLVGRYVIEGYIRIV